LYQNQNYNYDFSLLTILLEINIVIKNETNFKNQKTQ